MLIPITLSSSSSAANPKLPPCLAKISHDEVVLIELQGSLEVESNHLGERDGKHVGKLKIDQTTNKPTLIIGHHLLEGKIQALSKPLAVIVRSSKPRNRSSPLKISSRNDYDKDSGHEDMSMVVDIEDDGDPDHSRSEQKPPSGSDDEGSGLEPGASWAVVAVVKKKIIFSKRPMPITNKVTK